MGLLISAENDAIFPCGAVAGETSVALFTLGFIIVVPETYPES
jgi:hypothetical protein